MLSLYILVLILILLCRRKELYGSRGRNSGIRKIRKSRRTKRLPNTFSKEIDKYGYWEQSFSQSDSDRDFIGDFTDRVDRKHIRKALLN